MEFLHFLQPIMIAMAVLVIPASIRFGAKAITTRLDRGQVIAEQNRQELKESTEEEARALSALLETHRQEVLTQLTEIKTQTTATNGKVAEHDKDIVRLTARTDLLLELAMKGKAE